MSETDKDIWEEKRKKNEESKWKAKDINKVNPEEKKKKEWKGGEGEKKKEKK